jgi:CRP-like cAMP-binding protein
MTATLIPAADTSILRDAALFRGVETIDVDALCGQMDHLSIAGGDVIFTQDEPGTHLYFVVTGTIKLTRATSDGRQQLTALVTPGEQFGELSVFDPGPRTATATAVTDAQLASVAALDVREWVSQRPYIAERILHVLARRLRRSNDIMTDLIFVDVPGRLAKQLLQLARRFGTRIGTTTHVEHQLSQDELAQLIGASRETVNKTLAQFHDRGWIRLLHKSLVITDTAALARRARRQ